MLHVIVNIVQDISILCFEYYLTYTVKTRSLIYTVCTLRRGSHVIKLQWRPQIPAFCLVQPRLG